MRKKRTVFFKVFGVSTLTVFLGIMLLMILQYTLVTSYISSEREKMLRDSAKSLANIINTEASSENLKLILSSYATTNNYDILIVDKTGFIIMKVGVGNIADNDERYVRSDYIKDVKNGEENIIKGTMGGLFSQSMYTFQIPIADVHSKSVAGAIFLSSPMPEETRMNTEILKISLSCMILVIILSFTLSYTLSKRISRPIKRIGQSVKKFATGEFSERVKLEENDYTIKEISELTETFNNMASDLERFEDIRMNFISDVSHELRTPMTTIGGFIDGILDETIPEEKRSDYLKIVQSEVRRLTRLVNSFLDITRMKTDKIDIDPVNFEINEVIRLTLISLEKKIDSKNIQVQVEFCSEVCYVKADSDSIKRVITNLIDNAIKFTDYGGKIVISVTTKLSEVFISIYNTGCGIPKEEQKFIFERFYKVDKSRSLNKEGTGIGLYIVKSIIAAHGKDIKLESREGEYAKFTFSLDKGKSEK